MYIMCRSNRNFNTTPLANPGHLTILCARGVGNLICNEFPGVMGKIEPEVAVYFFRALKLPMCLDEME